MIKLRVEKVALPPDSDRVTLGTGTVVVSGEATRFVIPPKLVLEVLTALHAGQHPTIDVHEFDVVDWSRWWKEVPRDFETLD